MKDIAIWTVITEAKRDMAEKVLVDNGIDPEEAYIVLQALGFVLLDEDLYPEC